MTKDEIEKIENKLNRAMENAIKAGWYPRQGADMHPDGGCCILGSPYTPDAEYRTDGVVFSSVFAKDILELNCDLKGIAEGFDGRRSGRGCDPDAYAIGVRMRERYIVETKRKKKT